MNMVKRKPDVTDKIAKVVMKDETDESSIQGFGAGGAIITPLKTIREAQAENPNAAIKQTDAEPRYNQPSTAITALLPSSSMRSGGSSEEPIIYMTENMLDPAKLPFFTRLSDDEIKAIALLSTPYTACRRRAHSAFLENAIQNLIAYRVSRKAEGRTAFEKIMEALGFRREEAAKNPIQALFDMKAGRR